MAEKAHKPAPPSTPGQVGQVHDKVHMTNPKNMTPTRESSRGKGMK